MNISRKIVRGFMKQIKHTLVETCVILNNDGVYTSSVQNLNNKLSRDTIKLKEVAMIADVWGYEIRFVKKGTEISEENNDVDCVQTIQTSNTTSVNIEEIRRLALQILNTSYEEV